MKAREIQEDRTERADAIRTEAGSVRLGKKVFLLMVRLATPPWRGHEYLPANALANCSQHAAARDGLQAPSGNVRHYAGPAHVLGKKANDSFLYLLGSRGLSSVVPDASQ